MFTRREVLSAGAAALLMPHVWIQSQGNGKKKGHKMALTDSLQYFISGERVGGNFIDLMNGYQFTEALGGGAPPIPAGVGHVYPTCLDFTYLVDQCLTHATGDPFEFGPRDWSAMVWANLHQLTGDGQDMTCKIDNGAGIEFHVATSPLRISRNGGQASASGLVEDIAKWNRLLFDAEWDRIYNLHAGLPFAQWDGGGGASVALGTSQYAVRV